MERNKDNDSMEQCVVCKKYYLKGRGLKIHQKKAGCFSKLRDSHRKSFKSEAVVIQETNHSDSNSLVDLHKVETLTTSKTTTGGKDKAEEDPDTCREDGGDEVCLEEEIKIQVEEELCEEVRDWIEKTKETSKDSKKKKRERKAESKRDRGLKRDCDIRNWLGARKQTEETKDNEKDITEDSRDVKIGTPCTREAEDRRKRKEPENMKRGQAENGKQKDDCETEDLRTSLRNTQKQGKNEKKDMERETNAEEERRVVVERVSRQKENKTEDARRVVIEKENKQKENRIEYIRTWLVSK